MAIKDIFKVSRKTFFNPREWLGYDSLKDQTRMMKTLIVSAMTVRQPQRSETFEEALIRLEITQEQSQAIAKTYFRYALFFAVLAVADLLYGFYLLFYHGSFLGFMLALAVFSLLLAQAFRYHFWFFQINSRKLGCTFEEWRTVFLNKISQRKSS